MKKTMSFCTVSRVHITAHGGEAPSDEEWAAYLEDIKANLRDIDAFIFLTAGGTITTTQRDNASKFWSGELRRPRVAVLTPSVFVRTIVTTMSYAMGQKIRAFSADDLDSALSYLGLTVAQRVKAKEEVTRLRREFLEITSSRAAG